MVIPKASPTDTPSADFEVRPKTNPLDDATVAGAGRKHLSWRADG